MGRSRTNGNKHLPPRMRFKHGAYYHISRNREGRKSTWLGRDYLQAITQYAQIEECVLLDKNLWSDAAHSRAKRRAKDRGIPFTITKEQIFALIDSTSNKCPLSGIPFDTPYNGPGRNPYSPSLDRINSSEGYTMNNCRVVCLCVNYALNEWGTDVLKRVAKGVIKNIHEDT